MDTYKYICYYNNKEIVVESDTLYHAQLLAAKQFKAKKSYKVRVFLIEKNGQPVIHSPNEL